MSSGVLNQRNFEIVTGSLGSSQIVSYLGKFRWWYGLIFHLEDLNWLKTQLWIYFKATPQTKYFMCEIMKKINKRKLQQDIRKRTVGLHKSYSFLGTISTCMKMPCSFVQTIMRRNKHSGNPACSRSPMLAQFSAKCVYQPQQHGKRNCEAGNSVIIHGKLRPTSACPKGT